MMLLVGRGEQEGIFKMSSEKTASILSKILALLEPLESEERRRIVQASLVLLGEQVEPVRDVEDSAELPADLHVRARSWIKQNGLTVAELQNIFDLADGEVAVITPIGGKNNAEKTIKAYVLVGAARLLSDGDQSFDDKTARTVCESLGFYDSTNHMKYLKQKANYFIGSKDKGWKLTAPGLKYAAALVKELAKTADD